MKQQIFIHAGQPKTGTSALQTHLSRNAAMLQENGIAYPFPEGADVIASGYCTGNLMHMMQMKAAKSNVVLGRPDLISKFLPGVIQKGLSSTKLPKIIFSSEALTRHSTPTVQAFLRSLQADYDVTIVAFVRDVYDHAISAWKQWVKTSKTHQDFEEAMLGWVSADKNHFTNILNCHAGGIPVKLINYDHHRSDVYTAFMQQIGAESQATGGTTSPIETTNESLSFKQAKQVIWAKQKISSHLVSAILIKRFREEKDPTPDPYSRAVDEILMERLAAPLAKINALLPHDQKLRTTLRDIPETAAPNIVPDDMSSILEAVNEAFAIESARSPSELPKGMPAEFDADAYLMLNPDVAKAGIDAISHYLNNGKYEERSYR